MYLAKALMRNKSYRSDYKEIVDLLLIAGVNPLEQDKKKGRTVLHIAAEAI